MDYKYIEQLLERYWQCQTTLNEERILRDFFSQEDVPEELKRYRSLFAYEAKAGQVGLGADFDQKVLSQVEGPVVVAKRNSLRLRLMPFYRAAAVVAITACLGLAAQHSFQNDTEEPSVSYNYAGYKDTYSDPQVAYEQVSGALRAVSDGLRQSGLNNPDSLSAKQTKSDQL